MKFRLWKFLLFFLILTNSSYICKANNVNSYQGVSFMPGDTIEKNTFVISNTEKQLANGMIENYCLFNNSTFDEQTSGYFLTLDLLSENNNVDIVSGYSDYNASEYQLTTVSEQAKDYEAKHPNTTVLAGINADFFIMETGEPRGALVLNKKVYHSINKRNFFAITRDGTPVICDKNGTVLSKLKKGKVLTLQKNTLHAVGGGILLVKNGKIAPAVSLSEDKTTATRGAIGIKSDGTVIVYITHGTKKPVAYGETYQNVAQKMLKAGCQTAMALDGGGSSTYISNTGPDNQLEVRNHPSDGAQRQVASSLLFVTSTPVTNDTTSEKPTDENDHTHTYDPDENQILCNKNCNSFTKYTGFITDKDSHQYFLFKGKPLRGWKIIGEQPYYFNNKGISETVTLQSQTPATCTSTGNLTYYCNNVSSSDNNTFSLKILNKAPGHDYDTNYICKKCNWKAVSIEECTISTPYTKYYYTGKKRYPQVTISYKGKKLNPDFDYKISYKNNINIGTGNIIINPNVTTYIDITETRGSLLPGNEYEQPFSIYLPSPKNLKSTPTGTNSLQLSWNKSDNVDGYAITKYDSTSKSYKVYNYTTSSSCTVNDLYAGYTYGFRVSSYKLNPSGSKVYSDTKYVRGITMPKQVSGLKLSSSQKALTVSWKKTICSGYQIVYSKNNNFSNSKTITINSNSIISQKIRNLTKSKKYYVKVRAFKEATNCNRTYGKWSSVKSLKIQ